MDDDWNFDQHSTIINGEIQRWEYYETEDSDKKILELLSILQRTYEILNVVLEERTAVRTEREYSTW